MNYNRSDNTAVIYFRSAKGWKHRVAIFDGSGYKDLYMTGSIPNMTEEEYRALPDHIEVAQ